MPKEKWLETRDIVVSLEADLMKIAELIEETDSEEEADLIYKEVSRIIPAGDRIAHDMWDFMVDWKKVKWKEKEKEVT